MKRWLVATLVLLLFASAVRADITSNLVGWWKLDEPSGTTATDSGSGGNNGTYIGSPTLNVTGAFGTSKASTYNGTSQYITLAASPLGSSATVCTVSAWVNQWSAGSFPMVASWGDGKIELRYSGATRQPQCRILTTAATSPTAISLGTWAHLCGVYNGSTVKIYVDGVEKDSQAVSGTISSLTAPNFCARPTGTFLQYATVDDIRVYSRALSPTDVTELYQYTGSAIAPARHHHQQQTSLRLPESWRYLTRPKCETFFAITP